MRFSFIKDSAGHTQTSMNLFLEFTVKLAALMLPVQFDGEVGSADFLELMVNLCVTSIAQMY